MSAKRIPLEDAVARIRKVRPDYELPCARPIEAKPADRKESPARKLRVKRKRLIEKAKQFAEAVVDLATGNTVDDATFARRLATCESDTCGHLVRLGDGKLFCGACGCWKKNPLAELHTKLKAPDLECPCDPPLWTRIERQVDHESE